MKKKEILDLINANRDIDINDPVISNIEDRSYFRTFRRSEESWFPNIPELNPYFKILKNEIKESLVKTEEAKKIISNTKCNHSIRQKFYFFKY